MRPHQVKPSKQIPNFTLTREQFQKAATSIGVQTFRDWYKVDPKSISNLIDPNLLNRTFQGSLHNALSSVFPEHKWCPWMFEHQKVPRGYWQHHSNQKHFFDWLGERLGVKQLDDWYKVTYRSAIACHPAVGGILAHQYSNSIHQAITTVYDTHNWIPWRFEKVSNGFWKDVNNLKAFMVWAEKEIGINDKDDWYKVSTKTFSQHGGASILIHYGSLLDVLKLCFPDHPWVPWKFESVSSGLWQNRENHKLYFDWLAIQIGIKQLDDWYNVNSTDLEQYGARTVTSFYQSSLHKALSEIYPEHPWLPWKFKTVPQNFWKDMKNQRAFMDWAAAQLHVDSMDKWYSIKNADVKKLGGGSLLSMYNNSLHKTLTTIYSDFSWQPWKFQKLPNQVLKVPEYGSQLVKEAAEKLHIAQLDDWYRISIPQLRETKLDYLAAHHGSLMNLLKKEFPDHPWDIQRFSSVKKSSQRWLKVTLDQMFPNAGKIELSSRLIHKEIHEDFMHPKMVFPNTQRGLQLDVFIPELSLAFEYQGEQHYNNIGFFSPHMQRDIHKKALCKQHSITLIEVPYWWDKRKESLAASIRQHRPDLAFSWLSSEEQPIPASIAEFNKPLDIKNALAMTELDIAPEDFPNWWMTEYPQGIRAVWDGQKFIVKRLKTAPTHLEVPDNVKASLPSTPLDGVLRSKDGRIFKEALSSLDWNNLEYCVLDIPQISPEKEAQPLESRLELMKKMNQGNHTSTLQLKWMEASKCTDENTLKRFLDKARENKSGVLMRKTKSHYRSNYFQVIK